MGGKTTNKFRKIREKIIQSCDERMVKQGSGRGRSHLALPRDLGKIFSSTFQLGLGGKGSSGWLILPINASCRQDGAGVVSQVARAAVPPWKHPQVYPHTWHSPSHLAEGCSRRVGGSGALGQRSSRELPESKEVTRL